MHKSLSLYLLLWTILLSRDTYACFAMAVFILMLQYVYFIPKMIVSSKSQFQYCISCQKMTPQHFVHCPDCKHCFPIHYVHGIAGCMTEGDIKRYTYLVYIINIYLMILLMVWSMVNRVYFLGLLFHVGICLSFRQKNINRLYVF